MDDKDDDAGIDLLLAVRTYVSFGLFVILCLALAWFSVTILVLGLSNSALMVRFFVF